MPAACSTGAYPYTESQFPKAWDFIIGPVLRRRKVGEVEAKPVGQTFRAPEELAGCGEVPTFGFSHTNMPCMQRGKGQGPARQKSGFRDLQGGGCMVM